MAQFDEMVSIPKHHLDELRFYGFAGICVVRFQQLDEYLCRLFEDLVEISRDQAIIIFGSIRTIQRRCHVLTKLITEAHPAHAASWKELVSRIKQAEVSRDSIAHGLPVHWGKITMALNAETGSHEVIHEIPGHFRLEKPGKVPWTTETLLEEARKTEALLSKIYAFHRLYKPTSD